MTAPIALSAAEVRLDGIVKRFGEIEAVAGVTLEIRSGEFFTVLGPSGSGKSTLLHIVAGLEAPSAGRVYFRGKDVTDQPANQRRSSTVFQDLALFPHMSVGQNVEYGLKIRGEDPATRRYKAEALLKVVGLQSFYHRDVNKLSGGQRQRVALARSLVVEPNVLLLDEPLTGLDEKLRQQMQQELKRIHENLGTTFIAVTHNQEEALSMSDRIAVMRDGYLEQVGSPRQLYDRPVNAFVASFIGAANLLHGAGEPAASDTCAVGAFRFRFTPGSDRQAMANSTRLIAIRPERITVGPDAAQEDNRCRLALQQVTYKGAVLEYAFRFPDGQEIRAHILPDRASQPPAPGGEFELGWSVADTLLVAPDPKLVVSKTKEG
jgi:spermidine/putrescine transport system ATP-binding protein